MAYCTKLTPFTFAIPNEKRVSSSHFNKHLPFKSSVCRLKELGTFQTSLQWSASGNSNSTTRFHSRFLSLSLGSNFRFQHRVNCSYSDAASSEQQQKPLLTNLSKLALEPLREIFSRLTPIDVCKWVLVFSALIAATNLTAQWLFDPFFWTYFSYTWLFWPWFLAISVAIYGLYCLRKHYLGEANVFEQLGVVTSLITWLTIVPPAHFNGFLEGWPFVFFFVYHYFFFFNVSVRKRLYGDYYPRQHDPKWDIKLPLAYRVLFSAGVMIGHWLAAFEGPELHLIPGGWSNLCIWTLIMITLFAQYNSTLYLANYSEKVVEPTAVVQFGPFRWVRHPIYASTMLLSVTYCAALRAPMSALFIVAVCLMYYQQKATMEEAAMIDTFGTQYEDYMKKVRFRFIPFVY